MMALFSDFFRTPKCKCSEWILHKKLRQKQLEAARVAAEKQFDMLEYVVREEDYATGLRQQRALMSGAKAFVMFGRNEGGGQRFHGWVDRLIATADADLPQLFGQVEAVAQQAFRVRQVLHFAAHQGVHGAGVPVRAGALGECGVSRGDFPAGRIVGE